MKHLKHLFTNQFNTLAMLCVSALFSFSLIILRAILTESLSYMFLMWNLFLAFIPFGISAILKLFNTYNRFVLIFSIGIWLAFLPNAPYILTDFVHLRYSSLHLVWLDGLIISAFAFTGLVMFYISIADVLYILRRYIKPLFIIYTTPILCFTTAFGIYLGRFLRYNSWEIIQNPKPLFSDISKIVTHPVAHLEPWLFTLFFGMFLYIGYWCSQSAFNIKY